MLMDLQDRALRSKWGHEFEAKIAERSASAVDLSETRAIARASPQRFASGASDYDLVSNVHVPAGTRAPPRVKAPVMGWERLTMSTAGGAMVGGAAAVAPRSPTQMSTHTTSSVPMLPVERLPMTPVVVRTGGSRATATPASL